MGHSKERSQQSPPQQKGLPSSREHTILHVFPKSWNRPIFLLPVGSSAWGLPGLSQKFPNIALFLHTDFQASLTVNPACSMRYLIRIPLKRSSSNTVASLDFFSRQTCRAFSAHHLAGLPTAGCSPFLKTIFPSLLREGDMQFLRKFLVRYLTALSHDLQMRSSFLLLGTCSRMNLSPIVRLSTSTTGKNCSKVIKSTFSSSWYNVCVYLLWLSGHFAVLYHYYLLFVKKKLIHSFHSCSHSTVSMSTTTTFLLWTICN